MALDLEAIRKKLAALNGQKQQRSNVNLWKPELGKDNAPAEYRVRLLPWPAKFLPEGDGPLVERSFYFIGDNRGFLAPKQFGNVDPVEELIQQCHAAGDKERAKKLYPKSYAYVPVIVRGKEDEGVKVWKLNKSTYQRILGFFLDEDGGDIQHPVTGCDLKVSVFQTPGKQYPDTTVDMRKTSPLHQDEEVANKWLESVPSLDELFERQGAVRSEAEIKSMLDDWLDGKPAKNRFGARSQDRSDGTAKGAAQGADELEKIANEVAEKATKAASTKVAKKPSDDDEDVSTKPVVKKNSKDLLDDAFAELEGP